tara:strand:+ start:221 stop:334 length:114 start_codon:yes stop_codon:yes gene_type:complete
MERNKYSWKDETPTWFYVMRASVFIFLSVSVFWLLTF